MPFEAQDGYSAQKQQAGPVMLHIPDTMKTWPWPRVIHPLDEEVNLESIEWARQFVQFTNRGWDYNDVLLKASSGKDKFCSGLQPLLTVFGLQVASVHWFTPAFREVSRISLESRKT